MNITPSSMPKKSVSKKPTLSNAHYMSKKIYDKKQAKDAKIASASLTDCVHVIKGAVWCVDCATQYRARSRELYAKALGSTEQHSGVLQAAQTRLKKSLKEYSLTPAGLEELQRDYVNLVAKKDVRAKDVYQLIQTLTVEASDRNKEARKNEMARLARETTFNSHSTRYAMPKRNSDGQVVMDGITYQLTKHARDRMVLRGISGNDVYDTFHGSNVIMPIGGGMWSVNSEDSVHLRGYFETVEESQRFVIVTVLRAGQDDDMIVS